MRACTAKPRGALIAGLIRDAQGFQSLAGCDAELSLDEINVRDLLGYRVLHLDAGIALDEKVFATLGVDQKLDRPGVHIAGRTREADRILQDASPKAGLQSRCRRDLDNLLVSKLDRAVALVEMNDVAAAVGQDLDLDVTWPRDQLLDKHGAVAERRHGFALASCEGRRHLIGARDCAHAAAAAARYRFQHDRIADLLGDGHCVLRRSPGPAGCLE